MVLGRSEGFLVRFFTIVSIAWWCWLLFFILLQCKKKKMDVVMDQLMFLGFC